MRTHLQRLALPALLACLNGCGYMVQVNKKVDYRTVAIGTRRGDLWRDPAPGCQPCTEAFLRTHWGEPASRTVDDSGTTIWTYPNGLRWVGASPVILFPLPLFVPSGKEEIQFGLREGRLVFVRHHTIRRVLVYLPVANEGNITGGLSYASAPPTACVFRQEP